MQLGNVQIYLENEHYIGEREFQEDYFAFYFPNMEDKTHKKLSLILCDGMGGLTAGESTSVVATEEVIEQLKSGVENIRDLVYSANSAVNSFNSENKLGGTTLIILTLNEDHSLSFASVGDSSLFLFRNGKLFQLNKHHTFGAVIDLCLKSSVLTEEEIESKKNEMDNLTSYIGMKEYPQIDEQHAFLWQEGDLFLAATDGLTDTLSFYEIESTLMKGYTGKYCQKLLSEVTKKELPNQDNTTILAISLEKEKQYTVSSKVELLRNEKLWILITFLTAFALGMWIHSIL